MTEPYISSKSSLLVIDVQEKLIPAMAEEDREKFLQATRSLIELAGTMGARIVYTEQYPKGLGPTEESVLEVLKRFDAERVEKMTFDACGAPGFHQYLIELPKQIVVCGMEAHICVLMTVRELLSRRHKVIVPFDGVISRSKENRDNALGNMEKLGATVSNYESVIFDALRSAEHPEFKRFSRMIR